MKRLLRRFFFLSGIVLFLLSSCSGSKFRKLVQRGEVVPSSFFEVIPLEERLGLYCLQVELKGNKYRFLFDTGAPNVISKTLAKELKLKKTGSNKISDSQNRVDKLQFVKFDTLKINNLAFTDMLAVAVDLESIPIFRCLDIDGFVGANLMRQAFWGLDAQKKELLVSSELEKVLPKTNSYLEVPFWNNSQGTPHIELIINGIAFKNIIIDYGSTGGLDLNESVFNRKFNWEEVHLINRSMGSAGTGIFGASLDTVEYVLFDSLYIGDFKTEDHIVNLEKAADNKVGVRFLNHYYTCLDWKNNNLYLQPYSNIDKTRKPSFGFSIDMDSNGLFVSKIYENSPASKAGMKLNDRIIKMNHASFEDSIEDAFCDFFLNDSNASLHLTLERDGRIFEAELEKEVILMVPNRN